MQAYWALARQRWLRSGRWALALAALPFGLCCLLLPSAAATPRADAVTLVVGGKASLRIAVAANFRVPFERLAPEFTQASGIELVPIFGASGLLTAQIRQGAPFDVLLSADMERPRGLVEDGLAPGPVRLYARGRVALWTPGRTASPAAGNLGRIGLPNPRLAPYGQAAVECLQTLQLWDPLRDSLVLGSNVAQVGHFLRSGALPAGFVSLGQLVAMHVPAQQYWVCGEQAHRPIDQGAVVLRGGAAGQLAAAFLDFMTGAPVQQQLTDLGYVPVASDAPLADPGPLPGANPGPVANE